MAIIKKLAVKDIKKAEGLYSRLLALEDERLAVLQGCWTACLWKTAANECDLASNQVGIPEVRIQQRVREALVAMLDEARVLVLRELEELGCDVTEHLERRLPGAQAGPGAEAAESQAA
jgi:hypothetical protein